MTKLHEWRYPVIDGVTVCGLQKPEGKDIMFDLGKAPKEQRCGNCERMRGSIGTSGHYGRKK